MAEENGKLKGRGVAGRKAKRGKEFSTLTKKEQLKVRKEAYKIYAFDILTKGHTSYKRIARLSGMSEEMLLEFKISDKWDERLEKEKAKQKKTVKKELKEGLQDIAYEGDEEDIDEIHKILEESGLQDRTKLFILYYLQTYDAKHAAQRAGYVTERSHSIGHNFLARKEVTETITKIKRVMHSKVFVNAHDVLNEYIKIAFADITDFLDFNGQEIRLKSSDQVNGKLISEVRQGKDGITFKLHDKMKALDKLDKLFELVPDRRLQLEEKKFELQKEAIKGANGDNTKQVIIVNDL